MGAINKLIIEGFKSIRKLENFKLQDLNVLIGANGAGKSNFVSFFNLLRQLINQNLQVAVNTEGGADACLFLGPKMTKRLVVKLYFGRNGYEFALKPTVDNRLIFAEELTVFEGDHTPYRELLGSGHSEARLAQRRDDPGVGGALHGVSHYVYEALSGWVVYHFHDTSSTAGVGRQGAINDNECFRADAGNLAAYLYRIQQSRPDRYKEIRDVVRLAAPFFQNFKLRPVPDKPELIQLEWLQEETELPLSAEPAF